MKDIFSILLTIILVVATIAVIIGGSIFVWNEIKENTSTGEENVESFQSEFTASNPDVEIPQDVQEDTVNGELIVSNVSEEDDTQENNNNSENVQNVVTNVVNDRFLYNQLNEEEKFIYDAFEANKEDMKTGKAKIEFGDHFSPLLENSNGNTDILRNYYQAAVEAYLYDNPTVFYLEPTNMFLSISTTKYTNGKVEYEVYIDNGEKPNYLIEEFSSKEEVDNALQQIEQIKNYIAQYRTNDSYQNIKSVHDYLINSINYDETISKDNIYNIYGALVTRECVCEGYAKAFKYLLEEAMGVQCIMVVGTGTNSKGETERHAWNYVNYDNEWYAVDTTWDDPIIRGDGELTRSDRMKFFMKRGNEFNQTHKMSPQFTDDGKVFEFPEI